MLQAANSDLFNPLVPIAHNSYCQNILFPVQIKPVKSVKASLLIFTFCTLGTNWLKVEWTCTVLYTRFSKSYIFYFLSTAGVLYIKMIFPLTIKIKRNQWKDKWMRESSWYWPVYPFDWLSRKVPESSDDSALTLSENFWAQFKWQTTWGHFIWFVINIHSGAFIVITSP